jgi:hypothetical protein
LQVKSHTQPELQAALLVATDMPTGYAVDNSDNGVDEKKGVCGKPAVSVEVPSDAEARVVFTKGTIGPLVAEILASYKSADEAKKYLSLMNSYASSCTSYDDKNSDGTVDKVEISVLSFPNLGDGTLAFRIKSDSGSADLIFIRKRNTLIYVATAGLILDSSDDEPIAKKALQKATDSLHI